MAITRFSKAGNWETCAVAQDILKWDSLIINWMKEVCRIFFFDNKKHEKIYVNNIWSHSPKKYSFILTSHSGHAYFDPFKMTNYLNSQCSLLVSSLPLPGASQHWHWGIMNILSVLFACHWFHFVRLPREIWEKCWTIKSNKAD